MSIGYKVVGNDLCGSNGYKYEIGRTFVQNGKIMVCSNGLHYSTSVVDADRYGKLLHDANKIVAPLRYLLVQDMESDPNHQDVKYDKVATRTLLIVRELSLDEWIKTITEEPKAMKKLMYQTQLEKNRQQRLTHEQNQAVAREKRSQVYALAGAFAGIGSLVYLL